MQQPLNTSLTQVLFTSIAVEKQRHDSLCYTKDKQQKQWIWRLWSRRSLSYMKIIIKTNSLLYEDYGQDILSLIWR